MWIKSLHCHSVRRSSYFSLTHECDMYKKKTQDGRKLFSAPNMNKYIMYAHANSLLRFRSWCWMLFLMKLRALEERWGGEVGGGGNNDNSNFSNDIKHTNSLFFYMHSKNLHTNKKRKKTKKNSIISSGHGVYWRLIWSYCRRHSGGAHTRY